MPTLIHRRVAAAQDGSNPMVVARMASGWAVLGDYQHYRGYSLLLPDPVVPSLNALDGPARAEYLADMARLGDALLAVTGADRINYEILGNSEPALHAHLFPRSDAEPAETRNGPAWFGPWNDPASAFDHDRDRALMERIGAALGR